MKPPLARPALALLVCLLLGQAALRADEVDRRKLYARQIKGCASVMTTGGPASAWVVDAEKRWVATCQHVVGTLDEVELVFPVYKEGRVVQERDWYVKSATRVKAKVISADPKRDLAILQIDKLPDGAQALPLARDSAQPGESLYLIGNPAASGAMWNFSVGTLRALYKKKFTYKQSSHEVDALVGETQLPGNPGDSGGAVFGDNGEVLGVHCGGTPDGAQLMSTYIDVTEIRAFLKEPLKGIAKARTFDDYLKRGNEHFARGSYDLALGDYDEAIKANPQHSDSYRCRAGVLIRKKQYDAALKDADEAIRLDPKNAAAHNERAVCLGARGDFKTALESYSEAIRLNPKEVMFWGGRAWIHNSLKQHDKAVADASEALKINNSFAFAYNERGLAYLHLQQLEKAMPDLDQAVKLDGQSMDARHNRGVALATQGKFKDAIDDFSEVIRRLPEHAAAFMERGIAQSKNGAHDKAVKDFDRYLSLRPDDAQAFLWRSQCYKALGNVRMADADSRRAMELNPTLRPGGD
jgi:tetratricopeptide (TPR) repeat protein